MARTSTTLCNAKPTWDTRTMVTLALLAAIGALLCFLEIGNFGGFLKYDASFVPAIIGGFVYGPIPGFVIGLISVIIHALVSGNFWGALMNLCGVAALVIPAALIFRPKGTRGRAVAALIVGSALSVVVLIALNLVVTPIYTGMPVSAIIAMILPLLLPFNIFKAAVNAVLAFLLYGSVGKMAQSKKAKKAKQA